jgi:hypothetical protein
MHRVARNTRKRRERGKCTKGIRKTKVGVKDGDKKTGMGQKRPNFNMT